MSTLSPPLTYIKCFIFSIYVYSELYGPPYSPPTVTSAVMKCAVAMGHRPDNPAGDALGQALGRQQAVVQHMRALPHGAVADALAIVRASQGLDHHQAGVRVPGFNGGAIRRSAPGDVGRNGPGRVRLDHPRRAHEGEAGSPRTAFGTGARDPARRTETERWHRLSVPQSAWEATLQHDAIEIDQGNAASPPCRMGFGRASGTGPRNGRAHPAEVVEAALAHTVQNPTEAAYARSDLFERRRHLMDDWSTYLNGARGARGGMTPVTGGCFPSRTYRPVPTEILVPPLCTLGIIEDLASAASITGHADRSVSYCSPRWAQACRARRRSR